MKRTALLALAAVLLLAAPTALIQAAETQTLTGEYRWNHRDNHGDLEAVFTPTGESTWDVSFSFKFRGQDHTYSGTAEGSLAGGSLSGSVKNESEERSFTFEGSFENGTFSGTHAETTGSRVDETGTLTLSR